MALAVVNPSNDAAPVAVGASGKGSAQAAGNGGFGLLVQQLGAQSQTQATTLVSQAAGTNWQAASSAASIMAASGLASATSPSPNTTTASALEAAAAVDQPSADTAPPAPAASLTSLLQPLPQAAAAQTVPSAGPGSRAAVAGSPGETKAPARRAGGHGGQGAEQNAASTIQVVTLPIIPAEPPAIAASGVADGVSTADNQVANAGVSAAGAPDAAATASASLDANTNSPGDAHPAPLPPDPALASLTAGSAGQSGPAATARSGLRLVTSVHETPVAAAGIGGATAVLPATGGSAATSAMTSPAATSAMTSPPATVAAQVATAVASFAFTSSADGTPQNMTLNLHPADLGSVQISIDRNADGSAAVTVTAGRADTLALLQGDQQQLQHSLDQAGVPAAGRSVVFQLADSTPQTGLTAGAGTGAIAAAGGANAGSASDNGGGFGQGATGQHGQPQAGIATTTGAAGLTGGASSGALSQGLGQGPGLPVTPSPGAAPAGLASQMADGGMGAGAHGQGGGLAGGGGQGGGQGWVMQGGAGMMGDGFSDAAAEQAAMATVMSVQSLGVDIVA